MSVPRYPTYKDSRVEWISQVPSHWEVMPIRFAAKLESGHTPSRNHPEYWDNCTIPWFSLADVWQIREAARSVIYETKEKISELGLANSAARRLPAGTVMLSRTASVGFAAIMGIEMATTQDFANWVCGPRLLPVFLLCVFKAMRGEFDRLMMGSTHNTIYMPDLAGFRLALPPLHEQTAIAAFLDRETAKIDALVAEQERLIELLKEKRQAVISHAVTRGLNPDVPMKDSGIEWLRDVPEHWRVASLKYLVVESLSGPYGASLTKEMYTSSGLRVYGQQQVISNNFVLGDYYISEEKYQEMRRYAVAPGDVLVTVMGTIGKVAVVPVGVEPGIINPRLVLYRPKGCLQPDFLRMVLMSPRHQESLRQSSQGTTMDGLNMHILGGIAIPLPPPHEQREIMNFLKTETASCDALIAEAQRAIDILQERRIALISAAVTGQIDVRDAAGRAA